MSENSASPGAARAMVAAQAAAVVLLLAAVLTDPSIWRLPDALYFAVFPAVFAVLFAVGVAKMVRLRRVQAPEAVLTLLCGLLCVLMLLAASVPTSLKGF